MSAGRGRGTRREAAKLNAVNEKSDPDDSEGEKQGAVGGKEDSEVSDGQETTLLRPGRHLPSEHQGAQKSRGL